MQKAIVPKESLPPISSDGKYYFRYRAVSENKKLISDWSRVHSVSGKLVKDILGYADAGVFLEIVATEDGMTISWDLPVELQNTTYDVFVKWSTDNGATYTPEWILLSTVKVNTAYATKYPLATHMKARIQIESWDKNTAIGDQEITFDSESTNLNYVLVAESSVGVSTVMINDSGSIA